MKIKRLERRNEYIEKYLESYRKAVNTDFAVLLKGPWGCGKTYFIQNYCRRVNEKLGDKNATWYISLNGVKEIRDIDERLYQLAHPILGSSTSRFASRLLKGAISTGIRLSTGVEVRKGKSFGAEFGIDDVIKGFIPQKKIRVGANLLVLDDVERSCLDTKEIIGYISGFVEEGVKVVVVSADNNDAERKLEDNDGYAEKIIGKTFEIRNDLHDLFGVLVDSKALPLSQNSILMMRDVIASRLINYDEGKCNYRALRHSFRDVEFVFEQIPAKIRNGKEFIDFSQEFISWFVPLSYVVHIGRISEQEFDVTNIYDSESSKGLKALIVKFGIEDTSFLISGRMGLSLPILRKILWNRPFSVDELNHDILNSPAYYKKPDLPDWCKYWNWFLMDDEEAHAIELQVRKSIKKRKYVHPGEIIHVFSVLMSHVQDEIVTDLTKDAVIKEFESYVKDVVNSNRLILDDPARFDMASYGGYSWWSFDYGEPSGYSTRRLVDVLSEKVREMMNVQEERLIIETIKEWQNKPINLLRAIETEKAGEALFSRIKASDFIEIFIKLKNRDKHQLLLKMKERWMRIYDTRRYSLEEPFLRELLVIVQQKLDNPSCLKSTPSYDAFRRMKKYFKHAHEHILHELQP